MGNLKVTYSIYASRELVESFIRGTSLQKSDGKRIVEAMERCVRSHGSERSAPSESSESSEISGKRLVLSEALYDRLERLRTYRRTAGVSRSETLEDFLYEILHYLKNDLFYKTPKNFMQ